MYVESIFKSRVGILFAASPVSSLLAAATLLLVDIFDTVAGMILFRVVRRLKAVFMLCIIVSATT